MVLVAKFLAVLRAVVKHPRENGITLAASGVFLERNVRCAADLGNAGDSPKGVAQFTAQAARLNPLIGAASFRPPARNQFETCSEIRVSIRQ
jgi:hypothetical protein